MLYISPVKVPRELFKVLLFNPHKNWLRFLFMTPMGRPVPRENMLFAFNKSQNIIIAWVKPHCHSCVAALYKVRREV